MSDVSLTSREKQVFDLLGNGMSAKDIASLLSISYRTVEVHKANMIRKLRLPDEYNALLKYAIRESIRKEVQTQN